MKFIVNGRTKESDAADLSYEDVVALAATGRKTLHTVTYARGPSDASGELAPGQRVAICDGMVFNAMVTDNA